MQRWGLNFVSRRTLPPKWVNIYASLWEEYRTFQEAMFKNGQNVISIAIRKYQTATQTWQGLCQSNGEPWIKDDPKQATPLK